MKFRLETLKLSRLFDGPDKNARVKRNITGSLIIKGLSIGVSFVLVPISFHYLLPVKYGIWLTLSSIIGWFAFFDIGLGNGLRNRFAEALAQGNKELAKIYVSTTYTALLLIMLPVMIIFPIINEFLNWGIILNIPTELAAEVKTLALIAFELFCFQLVLQLISVLLTADQKPALSSLLNLFANGLSLVLIATLVLTTKGGSLLYLGVAMSLAPCLVFLLCTLWYYRNDYKEYAPSFTCFQTRYVRDLMGIGGKFFLIQISAIVLYATTNMLIAQLASPEDVTYYNIVFRYFNLGIMVLTIIITPFWSAITDAFYKNDIKWIHKVMIKLIYSWIVFVIVVLIMLAISNVIYGIWIGNEIHIPFALSFAVALFVIANGWNLIFVTFLNGVGKITLQLYLSFISSLVFIPLAILLSRIMTTSLIGVVTASVILAILTAIWTPIQYWKIINKRANGLWDK